MLPKQHRLTRRKDFDNLFKKGRSVGNKFLALKYKKMEEGPVRVGFVVSNKTEKSAVKRNRVKRQAREILKDSISTIKDSHDLAFVFKKPFLELDFSKKEELINNLLKEARLFS